MADHVALIREAAAKVRATGADFHVLLYAHPVAGERIADILEFAAHREEEFLAGLEHHDRCRDAGECDCAEPETGDEAALAVALARAILGRADA